MSQELTSEGPIPIVTLYRALGLAHPPVPAEGFESVLAQMWSELVALMKTRQESTPRRPLAIKVDPKLDLPEVSLPSPLTSATLPTLQPMEEGVLQKFRAVASSPGPLRFGSGQLQRGPLPTGPTRILRRPTDGEAKSPPPGFEDKALLERVQTYVRVRPPLEGQTISSYIMRLRTDPEFAEARLTEAQTLHLLRLVEPGAMFRLGQRSTVFGITIPTTINQARLPPVDETHVKAIVEQCLPQLQVTPTFATCVGVIANTYAPFCSQRNPNCLATAVVIHLIQTNQL